MTGSAFIQYPRAFMSASREELTNVPLTIRDGQNDTKLATLPDDLQGHLFLMAFVGSVASPPPQSTAPKALPTETVMPGADGITALFNGDGMVYRFDFHAPPTDSTPTDSTPTDSTPTDSTPTDSTPTDSTQSGKAWLMSRILKTPAYFADKITHEQERYQDFSFFNVGLARFSLLGLCNQINTALVPVQTNRQAPPRLVATNDVNRLFEIDPISLKIVAPVGHLQTSEKQPQSIWSVVDSIPGILEFVISSAHPCTDYSGTNDQERGELFTVSIIKTMKASLFHQRSEKNPNDANKCFLIRWNLLPEGKEQLERWELKHYNQAENRDRSIKILQSTHMLGITQNYIILADTAMKTEQIEVDFLLLLNSFLSLLELLKLTGTERQKKIQEIKKNWILLRRFIQLARLNQARSTQLFSSWIDELLQEMPVTLRFYKEPIRDIFGLLLRESTEPEEFASLDDRLSTHIQLFSLQKEGDNQAFSPLTKNSLVNLWRRFQGYLDQNLRALQSWLVNNFIKELRLKVASQQNTTTPLYIIKRSDLDQATPETKPYIRVKRANVQGAFAHFLTNYQETPSGEIVLFALMTDALDPAEYVNKYDRPQLLHNTNIRELSGSIPIGMDSNAMALIKINPHLPDNSDNFYNKFELTFDKIKASESYLKKEIYRTFRKDPLFLGLYAYRDSAPQITDIFVMQGGGFSELLTEFIFDLYKDYSSHRRIPLSDLMQELIPGVPMILTHIKCDPAHQKVPLQVVQTYEFEPGLVIYSLQFIPRAGSDPLKGGDDGYLCCTIVRSNALYSHTDQSPQQDWSDNSEIWIFDAKQLSQGPCYKLSHPHLNFGVTLHSTWLQTLTVAPFKDYSFEQDYGTAMQEFIENYLKIDHVGHPNQVRTTLENLFKEIGAAFDHYREER